MRESLDDIGLVLRRSAPRLRMSAEVLLGLGLLVAFGPVRSGAVAQVQAREDREGVEFFEKSIRPVLVEHCSKCHGRG